MVGEALIDVVERAEGPPERMPGGSPANVALALGRLGRRTRLVTVVAADDDGHRIRRWLADSGVTVESTAPARGRTSTARAVLDQTGAARYEFDLSWDPVEVEPGPVDVLHVGSIASVLAPGADAVLALVRRLRRSALVTFDPNARPAITPDHDAVLRRVETLVELADVVKVSDEDLAWYFPGEDPGSVALRWASHGPGLVVVTRGGDGATVARPDGTLLQVPGVVVPVADTIAAGDTFTAGLIDALVDRGIGGATATDTLAGLGEDAVVEAAGHAARAAAVTVSRPGADPPWRSELPLG